MNPLPEIVKGHLYVLILPRSLRRPMLNELTVRLALRGEVQVLVAGNRFDAHGIARLLRRQTTAVLPALQRIHLARAFTCYQVASLLGEVASAQLPTLVTDLLDPFTDENVSLAERRTLLTHCLQDLHRLSRQTEVLISIAQPRLVDSAESTLSFALLENHTSGPLTPLEFRQAKLCETPSPLKPAETPSALFEMVLSAADTLWTIESPNPVQPQLTLF